MKRMPALSIKDGQVVVTENQEYVAVGDPVEILRDLEKRGYEKFYVVDIEGIEKNRIQIEVVARLAEEFGLWLDGGFREVGVVEDALMLGVETAVIGTKSVKGIDEIKKAFEVSENIAVSVDYFSGILKWGEIPKDMGEISGILRNLGVERVVFSNLGERAPWKEAAKIFGNFELWFGGNLPENPNFEGIEGIVIPYSKLYQS